MNDILIVDDERDIRELIADILRDEGFDTRMAANSDEAVAALNDREPSLMILDIWLKDSRMDGIDILKPVKRNNPDVPVIIISGHGNIEIAVAAIKQAISGEDILSIGITRVGPFPPRMSNVGVVIDLAVHDIDLIRWFTESDIVEVQPQLSSAVAEREDIALLQFRTASGVLAHINTNWLTPFKARNVTIATRDKYIMGDLLTRQVTECFGFQPDGSLIRSVSHRAQAVRNSMLSNHTWCRSTECPKKVQIDSLIMANPLLVRPFRLSRPRIAISRIRHLFPLLLLRLG